MPLTPEIMEARQALRQGKYQTLNNLSPEAQEFVNQCRQRFATQVEPVILGMLNRNVAQQQNEKDKQRQIELLKLRGSVLNSANPEDQEKLTKFTEELHEVRRRLDLFPARITALGEVEQQARKNFAGV